MLTRLLMIIVAAAFIATTETPVLGKTALSKAKFGTSYSGKQSVAKPRASGVKAKSRVRSGHSKYKTHDRFDRKRSKRRDRVEQKSDRRHGRFDRKNNKRHSRFDRRRNRQGFLFFGFYGDRFRNDFPDDFEPNIPDPDPTPPPETAQPVEPEPEEKLDPRGQRRAVLARGIVVDEPAISVGQPIPAGIPIVMLDARRYDLPRAPRGEFYARVLGSVVRLNTSDRVVAAIVPDLPSG